MSYAGASLIVSFLAVAPALCPAQTNADPHALLEQIVAAERGTQVRHAEGVETGDLTGEGMNLHTEVAFKAVFRDPSHVRWETTGDNRTLVVCDGADHWTYSEPGIGFYRYPVGDMPCASQLSAFDDLLDHLVSITITGGDHVPFDGASQDCDVLRAEYSIPAARGANATAGTTIIRTLCVDWAQRLILRDRTESSAIGSNIRFVKSIAFSFYHRDAEIPADAFRFEVPTGTFLDPGPQVTTKHSAEDGAYRIGNGVSRPQLIKKVEPSWTEEARQAGVSGMVLVSFTVDSAGIARDISVTRGLGYGLDEKAIEAVRQWRFLAGMKNDMPVAVGGLTVAVDFRLP
jgi:TonB family protein